MFSKRFALLAVAAFVGCIASFTALPQQVTGQLHLSWTLPVTGCTQLVPPIPCDHVPLTGQFVLTSVKIWISPQPIPDAPSVPPAVELTPDSTTTTTVMTVANGAKLFARLSACNIKGCSPLTAQVEKVILADVLPGLPTQVTIDFVLAPAQ